MEKETLFVAVKWEILKALSTGEKSPMELAEITNSSVSNISQALRFLELAGLIKSERITNRDKGKPRVVYSLADDNAYLIVTAKGFAQKELITINERKKALLKIWLFEHKNLHRFIEKGFENLEGDLENYEAVMLDKNQLPGIELVVIPKDNKKKTIKEITYTHKNITKKITYNVIKKEDANFEDYYVIHNP